MTVRPSTDEDAARLAPELRAEDVAEVLAASGQTPLEALTLGFKTSCPCQTITYNSVPAAMFGVVPAVRPGVGLVWLLGSNRIQLFARPFHRHSKEWLERVSTDYHLLFNYVDERNKSHVRWLERLGFHFIARHPSFGVGRVPFFEVCKLYV